MQEEEEEREPKTFVWTPKGWKEKHRRDTEDGEKQDEMTTDRTIYQLKHCFQS